MAKETMISFLDQYLDKKIPDYDLALDWDTKNHSIEIAFRLYGENKEQIALDDVDGIESAEQVIEFEDAILLADEKKSRYDLEDYLTVITYPGKKGLPQGVLQAIVDYLREVLEEGQSDLLDFLVGDSEQDVFELVWNKEKFETLASQGQATPYLPYPSY